MPWQDPKTDWKIQQYGPNGEYQGDWFSLADYARVKSNIEYLGEITGVPLVQMPEQTHTVEGPLADIFNNIEQNLERIASMWYRPTGFQPSKTWAGNMFAPAVDDWNRWERNAALLYSTYLNTIRIALPAMMGMGGDV